MSLSFFGDKTVIPTEITLLEALSESKILWDNIENHVAAICGEQSAEWKYYSKKAGWSYAVKSGKRAILYLIPQDEHFKVSLVFGEKAVAAALAAKLPKAIAASIEEAVPYAEGHSFMFDVKCKTDVSTVEKLIAIKNEN